MKFKLSIQTEPGQFITVGCVKPTKTGKSWSLAIFADKVEELQRSQCGKFLNCLMVEDKRQDKPKKFESKDRLPDSGG